MSKDTVTFLCAVILPLLMICFPAPNARACAYSCGKETQTPLAWSPDGSQLLVENEGVFIDCAPEPTDAIPKITILSARSGAAVAWHSLDKMDNPKTRRVGAHPRDDPDYMDEKKYSLRDTGLDTTHTMQAKPMARRKVRITRRLKSYSLKDGAPPCIDQSDLGECEHLTVSIKSDGKWSRVWKGTRNARTDCGDPTGLAHGLPSKAVHVWPSPNGKRAAITYWEMGAALCCYSYGQLLHWVDLPTGSVADSGGATYEVYDTSGSDEPWLNLRRKPSMRSRIDAQLRDGTKIQRVGEKGYGRGGWAYKVRVLTGPHAGRIGFAGRRYLRSSSP